jgi:NAD(P)-dependent dehydrogenase (short-subunit alcohol dehydrogenase family)
LRDEVIMAAPLAGTNVIVTGGVRGLGRAMSLGLVAAGAKVAAIYRAASAAEVAAFQAAAGDQVLPLRCDIADAAQCRTAIDAAVEKFGAIHGLVNNAARGMQEIGPPGAAKRQRFFEIEPSSWLGAVGSNLNGAFLMARLATPLLVAQGQGRIVNIGTSFRSMMRGGYSPYGPTKAALEAATAIWAQDLAGTGVTVNTLMPGRAADTRMIPAGDVADRGKLLPPECMVAPICWLLSRASDGVTGRRFSAEDWDASLPPDEAAAKASVPAGWS